MSEFRVSLPAHLIAWIELQIKEGRFASAEDFLSDLVERDRERHDRDERRVDELREMVREADSGAFKASSAHDRIAEGDRQMRSGTRRSA